MVIKSYCCPTPPANVTGTVPFGAMIDPSLNTSEGPIPVMVSGHSLGLLVNALSVALTQKWYGIPLKRSVAPIFRVELVIVNLPLSELSQLAPVAGAKVPPKIPVETTADNAPTSVVALPARDGKLDGETETELIVAVGAPLVPVTVMGQNSGLPMKFPSTERTHNR